MRESIGVIGAGRIGVILGRAASKRGFTVAFYDIDRRVAEKVRSMGFKTYEELEELVDNSRYILVAVSQNNIGRVLLQVKSIIEDKRYTEHIVVFDTSTFKEGIIELYREFPENTIVASIHPMFGPGARKLEQYWVVVVQVPGREKDAEIVAELVEKLGFRVHISDWKIHDKAVALTIGSSYAVGIALSNIALEALEELGEDLLEVFSGTTYRFLRYHMESILLDLDSLAEDILGKDSVRKVVDKLAKAMLRLSRGGDNVLEKAKEYKSIVGEYKLRCSYRAMYYCLEQSLCREK